MAFIAVTALALVTAGCVKVDMDFVVNDDGSGSFSQKITFAEPTLELMVSSGQAGTREQACDSFIAESEANESPLDFSADGVDTSDLDSIVPVFDSVSSDSECSTTQSFSWTAAQYGTLREVMAAGDGPQILQLDDGWRFELSGSFMDQGPSDGEVAQLSSLGLDPPTAIISVTLPGEPVEHNADIAAGSTFSWEFDLTDPQSAPERLVAQTGPSSGGIGYVGIVGLVVAVVLLLAALVSLRKHRGTQVDDADDSDAEPAAAQPDPESHAPDDASAGGAA
ncbi:hypothetical protein [Candidatus Poriferisodalis sp.]|uniref:hypothetical protein n=1 Tax=Candidatus Poriferisodalis sp. TaxID=3101277 RepID=UPI003B01C937